MFAKINHCAIISPQYTLLAKFYEAVFGFRHSNFRLVDAPLVADGYVGMQLIPRRDGYVGGLDHFGMAVDDVEIVLERMKKKHTKANVVRRPSTRPYAAYSGHDPDGNVFDLAVKNDDNRKDLYKDQADGAQSTANYINRFAIRTPNAEACAEFYSEVFELKPVNRKTDAPGYHLTDGRMTLSILPWSIPIFGGMSIKRPGPDHIGIHVENLDVFKKHLGEVAGANPYLAPVPLGGSPESNVRRDFFQANALGAFQMTDPDGNWLDIGDE
jgi:catechol 2,3-dioxygenase-like lactoylglutathione lyase family enzyme